MRTRQQHSANIGDIDGTWLTFACAKNGQDYFYNPKNKVATWVLPKGAEVSKRGDQNVINSDLSSSTHSTNSNRHVSFEGFAMKEPDGVQRDTLRLAAHPYSRKLVSMIISPSFCWTLLVVNIIFVLHPNQIWQLPVVIPTLQYEYMFVWLREKALLGAASNSTDQPRQETTKTQSREMKVIEIPATIHYEETEIPNPIKESNIQLPQAVINTRSHMDQSVNHRDFIDLIRITEQQSNNGQLMPLQNAGEQSKSHGISDEVTNDEVIKSLEPAEISAKADHIGPTGEIENGIHLDTNRCLVPFAYLFSKECRNLASGRHPINTDHLLNILTE